MALGRKRRWPKRRKGGTEEGGGHRRRRENEWKSEMKSKLQGPLYTAK